jgi:hypothetical protein
MRVIQRNKYFNGEWRIGSVNIRHPELFNKIKTVKNSPIILDSHSLTLCVKIFLRKYSKAVAHFLRFWRKK